MRACFVVALAQMEPLPLEPLPDSKNKTHSSPAPSATVPINNPIENTVPGTIHTHSVGFGLGETFLLGQLKDHGDDSITFDALYSYSASYTFDLFIDAH